MPASLVYKFAKKPDLILELLCDSDKDAQNLISAGFHRRDGAEDDLDEPLNTSYLQVEMLVSSTHLTEASTYFETLLDGNFCEAETDPAGGMRCIALKDIDVMAFTSLMNTLHLHIDPTMNHCVSFSTLFQFCILVDMYGIHDRVAFHTNSWFEGVKGLLPKILRSCVEVEEVTEVPLSPWIRDQFNITRTEALRHCAANLQSVLDLYEGSTTTINCTNGLSHCDELVRGAFERQLEKLGLFPPTIETLQRLSIDTILKSLSKVKIISFCGHAYSNNQRDRSPPSFVGFGQAFRSYEEDPKRRDCGFNSRVLSVIAQLREQSVGFSIKQGDND